MTALARLVRWTLVLTLTGAACAAARGEGRPAEEPASDVLFKDLAGRVTTLRPYLGKVVVVHVFTTWEMAGLREVPELNRLVQERREDVQVVGVGVDMEGAPVLRAFQQTFKPVYPVWLPGAAFQDGKTVFGRTREVPRVFILGRDGAVRQGYVGYVPYADLLKLVDRERR